MQETVACFIYRFHSPRFHHLSSGDTFCLLCIHTYMCIKVWHGFICRPRDRKWGKLVLCFCHGFKLVPSRMTSGNCIWQVISLIFIFNTKYKLSRVKIDSMCSSGRPQTCDPLIPIPDSCHEGMYYNTQL